MLEAVLRYSLLVALAAAFSFVYFTWLKSSMDGILSREKGAGRIHFSFVLRLAFAVLFFRVMLMYYPGVWEEIALLATFVATRCLILKREARR